jgi:hypothetical protein
MGEVKPAGNDAGLPTVLAYRADGLAADLLARPQLTDGISPAITGVLIYRYQGAGCARTSGSRAAS